MTPGTLPEQGNNTTKILELITGMRISFPRVVSCGGVAQSGSPARHRGAASLIFMWEMRGAARPHLVSIMCVGFLSCKILLCSCENNTSDACSVLAGLRSPGSRCKVH